MTTSITILPPPGSIFRRARSERGRRACELKGGDRLGGSQDEALASGLGRFVIARDEYSDSRHEYGEWVNLTDFNRAGPLNFIDFGFN